MIKCSIVGCWEMAPLRSGLCALHRDRRSSPDRDETQGGSVGEADRAPVPEAIAKGDQS